MTWRNDAGLADRSVVVTGAAGGIGRPVVQAFAEAGAHVVAVDVPGSPVRQVVEALPGAGRHHALELDLRDLAGHAAVFARAREVAPLAALAHLAGVLRRVPTVDEVTEEDWDIQHEVNLKGTFFLDREAHRAFRDQGTPGAIVNFTSQGWWTGGFGGSVAYAASKGGIVSLTRGLARSFAPDGVRVNAVSPGGVDTPMFNEGHVRAGPGVVPRDDPARPGGAPGRARGAVVFLAGEASSYVTGAVLNVSGGQLMY
jgi:NAD(P)-dependent dehydrogenase (short-subunit alcohol dehydrogenase family)